MNAIMISGSKQHRTRSKRKGRLFSFSSFGIKTECGIARTTSEEKWFSSISGLPGACPAPHRILRNWKNIMKVRILYSPAFHSMRMRKRGQPPSGNWGLHGAVFHARNAFKNPFPRYYNVNAIPRFMLIDAEGKMITDELPRPQDADGVKAIIDRDLY